MATVLKRPMFKLGGSSDGVGITSGFRRTGYANAGPVDPTELQPQIPEWWDLLEGQGGKGGTNIEMIESQTDNAGGMFNPEISEMYKKLKNPEKEKYGKPDLLWDMYRTSKDAVDWKDWVSGGADLALERRDAKKLEDKNRNAMLFAAALKGGKAETDYLRATTDPQTIARMNLMNNVMATVDKWKADNPNGTITDFLQSGNIFEIDSSMRSANPSWPGVAKILLQIEDEIRVMMEKRKITDPPIDKDSYRDQQIQLIIGRYLGFDDPSGNAMGGKPIRRGYNMGMGPVMDQQTDMSMTENIQTPGGDMSMTENIDTNRMEAPSQTMPSDDPFVLLRARLPQEIPDDVVRLIAYNPEAFTDFADIETQDDVIAFNKKYGVELVVNTDEMSGAIA